jgi:hypothetical protein
MAVARAFVATVPLTTRLLAQQLADTPYRAMQLRGQQTMGVDQATSRHGFESLPDGGRIVLVRNVDDSAGVARVQNHLRDMQRAFGAGDFSMPMAHPLAENSAESTWNAIGRPGRNVG